MLDVVPGLLCMVIGGRSWSINTRESQYGGVSVERKLLCIFFPWHSIWIWTRPWQVSIINIQMINFPFLLRFIAFCLVHMFRPLKTWYSIFSHVYLSIFPLETTLKLFSFGHLPELSSYLLSNFFAALYERRSIFL